VILPVEVNLTRLAVPLCVLSLGTLFTPYCNAQVATGHRRLLFDDGVIFEQVGDFVDHDVTKFPVGVLASAVEDRDAYLVAFGQKFADLSQFDVEVALTDLHAEPHLLKLALLAFRTVLLLLFHLLVLVFTPVDYFSDRRISARRDLNQIDAGFLR
jgi:hypothetical protein